VSYPLSEQRPRPFTPSSSRWAPEVWGAFLERLGQERSRTGQLFPWTPASLGEEIVRPPLTQRRLEPFTPSSSRWVPEDWGASLERLRQERGQGEQLFPIITVPLGEVLIGRLAFDLPQTPWTGQRGRPSICTSSNYFAIPHHGMTVTFSAGQFDLVHLEVATAAVSRIVALVSASFDLPRHERVAAFARDFAATPEQAVNDLARDTIEGIVRAEETAAILLPYLVKASYGQQNLVSAALLGLATPDDLINAALAGYARDEDPRLLQEAAGLLQHYGRAAWPALAQLASSERSECRYFVDAIAGFTRVAEDDKQRALADLARNPDIDVRREVVEMLGSGCLVNAGPVWEVLAHDRDEEISSCALDHLAVLRD
jgi:hypothetical protein